MIRDYAISTALFQGETLAHALDSIAASGFLEVELSGGNLQEWLDDLRSVRCSLVSCGLRARSIHTPVDAWDIAAVDDAARAAVVASVARTLEQAAELGVEYVIVHPDRRLGRPDEDLTAWQLSRDSLEELARRAGALGVKMAVENMPWRERDYPGASVPEILALIEGLGDHVGVCLDAGHSNVVGLSAAQEVLDGGQRLFALHIQDNDGQGQDQHLLPGIGTIDWPGFLKALDKIAFGGMRTFEVLRGDDPTVLLQRSVELARMWERRGEAS